MRQHRNAAITPRPRGQRKPRVQRSASGAGRGKNCNRTLILSRPPRFNVLSNLPKRKTQRLPLLQLQPHRCPLATNTRAYILICIRVIYL